jgi:hypothetical protein
VGVEVAGGTALTRSEDEGLGLPLTRGVTVDAGAGVLAEVSADDPPQAIMIRAIAETRSARVEGMTGKLRHGPRPRPWSVSIRAERSVQFFAVG